MAIGDDTAIDYANRIIDLTGSVVYDVSVLYSYCKEQFKLSPNIDDDFAWDAPTPVDFVLKNKWYFRRHGVRRLKNGSITATYGTDEVEKIELVSGGYVSAVEGDIGLTVNDDASPIGELVDFDNTRRIWWVRTNGTTTTVAASSTMAIVTGTGAGTSVGVGSVDDSQDQWSNVTTIGDLAATGPQPFIYAFVGDLTTGDALGNARRYEGFEDDPDPALTNADRGVLDVLLNIIDAGTTLGNPAGEVRIYGRQGLDKFADFAIDITAGGRISVPISQSNDTEDTIGEVVLAMDGRNATDPVAGETVTWTGGSAELVTFIEGANSTNGVVILRGLTAYPADNDALTFSGGGTALARGTVGGQLITIDAEGSQVDEADYGNTITGGTSGHQSIVRGHLTLTETGTGQGYVVVESNHDVEADGDFYIDAVDDDVLTGTGINVTVDIGTTPYQRLCFDLDDIRIKQAFQRLTGITSGDAARGDNITQAVSGAKGTILEVVSGSEIHVGTNNGTPFDTTNTLSDDDSGTLSGTPSTAPRDETFQYALALQSLQNYWLMVDGAGRTNTQIFHYVKYFQESRSTGARSDPNAVNADNDQHLEIYQVKQELGGGTLILQLTQGEEYFRGFTDEDTPANNPVDQSQDSRLLVKPGASITTGQGVALINVASADANNQVLTDTAGAKHTPFTSVALTISNTVSGDHISVALATGGQEDKTQVASGAGNSLGDSTLVLNAALPNDTPTGSPEFGVCKITDAASSSPENAEMRYRYASFSSATLTLSTGDTGTAEGGSSGNTLVDTGAFGNTVVIEAPGLTSHLESCD